MKRLLWAVLLSSLGRGAMKDNQPPIKSKRRISSVFQNWIPLNYNLFGHLLFWDENSAFQNAWKWKQFLPFLVCTPSICKKRKFKAVIDNSSPIFRFGRFKHRLLVAADDLNCLWCDIGDGMEWPAWDAFAQRIRPLNRLTCYRPPTQTATQTGVWLVVLVRSNLPLLMKPQSDSNLLYRTKVSFVWESFANMKSSIFSMN